MGRKWLIAVLISPLFLSGLPSVAAAEPSVSALSAVIYEPQTGWVLYQKEGDTSRPMASTTKLMTALLAAERLDPDREVRVPAGAVPVEGTQIGLAAGDAVTVRDLLAGLLLASGNDAANALALLMADTFQDFAVLMNRRAAELGMINSHFVTPSGLDAEGHSASARDMAVLAGAVLKQPLLAELCCAKSLSVTVGGRSFTVTNHNKLSSRMPDCIGLKTGFTKKSGRCLVSAAQREGITLVVVTLNAGDDWNDHEALYDYGFSLVEWQSLPELPSLSCPVVGGTADRALISVDLPTGLICRIGETLRWEMELPRFVWAPLSAGETIGTLTLYGDNEMRLRLPLTASVSVAQRAAPPWRELVRRRFCRLWQVLLQ